MKNWIRLPNAALWVNLDNLLTYKEYKREAGGYLVFVNKDTYSIGGPDGDLLKARLLMEEEPLPAPSYTVTWEPGPDLMPPGPEPKTPAGYDFYDGPGPDSTGDNKWIRDRPGTGGDTAITNGDQGQGGEP